MRKINHRKHQGRRLIKVNNNTDWKDQNMFPADGISFNSKIKTYTTLSCVIVALLVYPTINLFKGLITSQVDSDLVKFDEQHLQTSKGINNNGQNNSPDNIKSKSVSKSDYNTMHPTAEILHQVELFKPKLLKGLSPKTIHVDGRRIAPEELKPTKKIDTSVR